MNFIFTEEQIQFKDTIKSFLAEECTPASIRDGWEKNKSFNFERWKNLIELGVLNSNLPEAKGGLGMDQVTLALMVEEMGYAGQLKGFSYGIIIRRRFQGPETPAGKSVAGVRPGRRGALARKSSAGEKSSPPWARSAHGGPDFSPADDFLAGAPRHPVRAQHAPDTDLPVGVSGPRNLFLF